MLVKLNTLSIIFNEPQNFTHEIFYIYNMPICVNCRQPEEWDTKEDITRAKKLLPTKFECNMFIITLLLYFLLHFKVYYKHNVMYTRIKHRHCYMAPLLIH